MLAKRKENDQIRSITINENSIEINKTNNRWTPGIYTTHSSSENNESIVRIRPYDWNYEVEEAFIKWDI